MAHAAMPHVVHRQDGLGIDRRHRRAQSFANRKRAADVTGTAQVLRKNSESILAAGFDDHVERFGRGDAELIDFDRPHM